MALSLSSQLGQTTTKWREAQALCHAWSLRRILTCSSTQQLAHSHLWHNVREKETELLALRLRITSPVAHDNTVIAKVNEASEVLYQVRRGPRACITAAVCTLPGLSDVEKELMTKTEVGKAPPVCLAQLLEYV